MVGAMAVNSGRGRSWWVGAHPQNTLGSTPRGHKQNEREVKVLSVQSTSAKKIKNQIKNKNVLKSVCHNKLLNGPTGTGV